MNMLRRSYRFNNVYITCQKILHVENVETKNFTCRELFDISLKFMSSNWILIILRICIIVFSRCSKNVFKKHINKLESNFSTVAGQHGLIYRLHAVREWEFEPIPLSDTLNMVVNRVIKYFGKQKTMFYHPVPLIAR